MHVISWIARIGCLVMGFADPIKWVSSNAHIAKRHNKQNTQRRNYTGERPVAFLDWSPFCFRFVPQWNVCKQIRLHCIKVSLGSSCNEMHKQQFARFRPHSQVAPSLCDKRAHDADSLHMHASLSCSETNETMSTVGNGHCLSAILMRFHVLCNAMQRAFFVFYFICTGKCTQLSKNNAVLHALSVGRNNNKVHYCCGPILLFDANALWQAAGREIEPTDGALTQF